MSAIIISKSSDNEDKKAHPWRICPMGKHFVREHVVHIPPSKSHPEGSTSTWHEHCASNLSHKDELSYHKIQYITETYFGSLSGSPTPGLLTRVFPAADNYDVQIRGWVKCWIEYKGYWGEVNAGQDPEGMQLFRQFYKILQGN